MEIQKRIEEDLKKAMRDRAEVVRDTLRLLLSDHRNTVAYVDVKFDEAHAEGDG